MDSGSEICNSAEKDNQESATLCYKRPSCSTLVHFGKASLKRGLPEENGRHVRPKTLFDATESNVDLMQSNISAPVAQPVTVCKEESISMASEILGCSGDEHVMTVMPQLTDVSSQSLHINMLPHCVLVYIFRLVPMTDRLKQAALVCRFWHHLTQDPDLWHEINLRGLSKVDDSVLGRVVHFSKRVTLLDITDCRRTTDAGMENVLTICKDVNQLVLVRCQQLTSRTFRSIADNSRNLKTLNLSCCFPLDDASISMIGAGCRMLVSLKLNQCSKVTDCGISELAISCPNLESLSIDQCTKIKGSCIKDLVASCVHLKSLSCRECPLAADSVKLLSQLKHLMHLEISGNSSLTDEVVIVLVRGCPLLQCLNLSLCRLVTNEAVLHLAKYSRHLQSLHLVSCAINDHALELLATHCQKLQTLDVAYCSHITTDAAVLVSTHCKNLRYLGLMRCDRITDEEAEKLAERFPRVHYSSMWLDCKRVLEKAKLQGFSIPDSTEIFKDKKNLIEFYS